MVFRLRRAHFADFADFTGFTGFVDFGGLLSTDQCYTQ